MENKEKLSKTLKVLFGKAGVDLKQSQTDKIVDLIVATVKEQYRADRPEREERPRKSSTPRPRSTGKKLKDCKYCGETGFTWGKDDEGKWKLLEADGSFHKCDSDTRDEFQSALEEV